MSQAKQTSWWRRVIGGIFSSEPPASEPAALREVAVLFGLPQTPSTLEELFVGLTDAMKGVPLDWRDDPWEVVSSLRRLAGWPAESAIEIEEDFEAEYALGAAAWSIRHGELRMVNLTPGTDGWFIVLLTQSQITKLKVYARRAGLEGIKVI